jgi:putative endonuclease
MESSVDDDGRHGHTLPMPQKSWLLYVLRCRDQSLYCGITNDLPRRLHQHDQGKGARYTRGRGPVVLLRSWKATNHSAALKAERAFKKLTRQAKELKLKSRAKNDPVSRLLRGESARPVTCKRTRPAPQAAC